jgi:NAD(P)-dependent dehydrogenase (short-subunit alcohol dehydrogenase family)
VPVNTLHSAEFGPADDRRAAGLVTSRSAHRGDDADHLAYGAAKAGLLSLTKGIARGFGRDGVLAYAVAPGWVRTELAADHLATADTSALPWGDRRHRATWQR